MIAIVRRALIFAALALLYDIVFSWLATCDPGYQQASAYDRYYKHCDAFAGPLLTFLKFFASLWDSNSIIAVFTVILGLATILLFWATRDLVRGADRNAERQLRAYIAVRIGDAFRQGAVRGLRFAFRPVVLNTGQTPAYFVNSVSGIQFLTFQEASTFDFRLTPSFPINDLSLGPRQDRIMFVDLPRILSKAELRQFRSNIRHLFIFGTVTYLDGFDRLRFTNYCYFISGWNRRSPPIWNTFHRHNNSS